MNKTEELFYNLQAELYKKTEILDCGYMGIRCDENQSGKSNYQLLTEEILKACKESGLVFRVEKEVDYTIGNTKYYNETVLSYEDIDTDQIP